MVRIKYMKPHLLCMNHVCGILLRSSERLTSTRYYIFDQKTKMYSEPPLPHHQRQWTTEALASSIVP